VVKELLKRFPEAVYKKNEQGDLPVYCAAGNDTASQEVIQEELFEQHPKELF